MPFSRITEAAWEERFLVAEWMKLEAGS